jgi:hypothetical protein
MSTGEVLLWTGLESLRVESCHVFIKGGNFLGKLNKDNTVPLHAMGALGGKGSTVAPFS